MMQRAERFNRHGVPKDWYYYALRGYMLVNLGVIAWGLLGFPGSIAT